MTLSMTRLLLRSAWRFRRTNLGVMLGVAVAAAVITGAFIVGDSMRHTLQRTAGQRLGSVNYAVIGGDRLFTAGFANSLHESAGAALIVEGVASTPDGNTRANGVQVNGVDADSADIIGLRTPPQPGEAFINDALAQQLGTKPGDTLVLRVPEPSALPVDAALVNASTPAVALRLRVGRIVDADRGGRFSLRAEQRTPMNLFVDRAWLAEQLGVPGRANAAFSSAQPAAIEPGLDDLELSLDELPDRRRELTTPRIFIDASIERDLADLPGQRLLTYLVNTVAHKDNTSPYAMVTATNRLGDLELNDDQIAINRWLADDIGAAVGNKVTLTYYLPDEGGTLVEASAAFTVARIVPIEGVFDDRALTPDFPGLAEADTLRGWDAGPAIDRSRIRDKDEAYWDNYRATPKAYISLDAGQRLWANRFGTLTAIRFDRPVTDKQLLSRIDTAALGFVARDLRAQANHASVGTVDFGQLFLSLSGFIIIAAIVLTATLFAMSVEQRARQLGALLAVGLTRRQVLVLIVGEGSTVCVLGGVLGALGGLGYAAAVVEALGGLWSGAVAGTPIRLHFTVTSLVAGPIGAAAVSVLAMVLAVRALTARAVRELLAGAVGKVSGRARVPVSIWVLFATLCAAAAALLAMFTDTLSGMKAGMMGFAAGALTLSAALLVLYAALVWTCRPGRHLRSAIKIPGLALRNLTRRRGRTLAAVVTLSCGVFLVLAIAGFRLGVTDDPSDRASGTGGFALIVEPTQPIRYDLNTQLGRDHYGLSEDELPPGSVVPFRVNDGDDASCLNLNQTTAPRVIGVDPALLMTRDAFTFQSVSYKANGWGVLNAQAPLKRGNIPAIADANTAQWALKLAVGDKLTLTDERGQPFTLQLVATIDNTILQGSLIISEAEFERLYPSTSGHRLLLVDAADNAARDQTAALLQDVMIDEGVTITNTQARLAEYNTVQNTYLTIFQMLGGLGVVLGALGLGVITARNLLERRAELALLSAVGFTRGRVLGLALIEHALVLVAGLSAGLIGAWVATLHTGKGLGGADGPTLLTLSAVLIAGLFAVAMGLRSAVTGRLTDALRND